MHLGTETWESGPKHGATTAEHEALHRLRREERLPRRAGRRLEQGLGRRLVRQRRRLQLHRGLSGLRPRGARGLREERRACASIGHHETAGNIAQLREAARRRRSTCTQQLGIDAVKTGYVADAGGVQALGDDGTIHFEWHDGQVHVAPPPEGGRRKRRSATSRSIAHEPIKDTGLRRTYPNWVVARRRARHGIQRLGRSAESARARSEPGVHAHAGRADGFHAGRAQPRRARAASAIQSTLAKQLALYVVLYSPIQMAADLPENYAKQPEAVPVHQGRAVGLGATRACSTAKSATTSTIARKDRNSDDWYLGAITDENARTLQRVARLPRRGQQLLRARSIATARTRASHGDRAVARDRDAAGVAHDTLQLQARARRRPGDSHLHQAGRSRAAVSPKPKPKAATGVRRRMSTSAPTQAAGVVLADLEHVLRVPRASSSASRCRTRT